MFARCVILGAVLCCAPTLSAIINCDPRPKGASGAPQPVGTKYRISIASNPQTYNPGQQYTVILQGKSSVVEPPNEFNGFKLSVELEDKSQDDAATSGPLAAGIFQLIPTEVNTKIDEKCPNTIVHASHVFTPKIEVLWTAPEAGTGCVRFKASVMEQNFWYQHDAGLTLVLCDNTDHELYGPPRKCCSCNEAKYEMKFEGLWTRQSHPLHFPENMWLTRFSDVIGASHATDYYIWRVNELASAGLTEFSEEGNTAQLEMEIKTNQTRTVVKAKGVMYPNITGKTFAVFRVDPHHHLLSLVSLIKPSPDWFVGISGLELCNKNCTWISQKILDLYPYDLGLWADVQYESKTKKQMEPIRKIDHSDIPESPFYTKDTEELKPMARVYLTKSREYEKNEKTCQSTDEENRTTDERTETGMDSLGKADRDPSDPRIRTCETTEYGPWSNCSREQCDPERVRIRVRQFPESVREYCKSQNVADIEEERCEETCPFSIRRSNTSCPANPWEPFSECGGIPCARERKRTAKYEKDKKNPACLNTVWKQVIYCSPEECAPPKSNKGKSGRRKQHGRKYNVTISASYTYVAEHDTSLCANTTSSKG